MIKKLLAALLCLMLFAGAAAFEREASGEGTDARIFIARNDRLTLYLSEDLCSIEVEDAYTGRTWSSAMNDETAVGMKINALWQKKISSLITVYYTNLVNGLGVVNNQSLLNDKQLAAGYELMEGGVRLFYDLGAIETRVCVEILLDGESLVARVPWNGIEEYGKFSITSISMLPFLLAATDSAEGYFVYPDGCGAVMEFRDNAHMGEKTVLYQVYGAYEKQDALLDMFDEETPRVFMPVFGMNRAGVGLLTVIEDGAESTQISLNSSSKIVGVNYLFASFIYRRSFHDMRVTTRDVSIFDAEAIQEDHQIRVLFPKKENPDYGDLACAWREYLLSTGRAQRKADSENQLLLDLFMTASEKGLLFDKARTVTTIEQTEEILKALDAAGVRNICVSLKGLTKGGYGAVPNRFPVSAAVGSAAELRQLSQTAHDMGAKLLATVNVTEASDDEHNYSKRNDVVYTGNRVILTDKKETMMMLSADVARDKLLDMIRDAKDFGLDGMRLERIGLSVGYNYWSKHYLRASETLEIYLQMLDEVKQAFGIAQAEGGNTGLLGHTDALIGIPYEDHGYQVTSYSVPFYQVALHGIVNYAAVPGNLSSDLDREVLRWVEMGYQPYFELSYENTEKLIYTTYKGLFSAQYTAWLDRVAEASKQFSSGRLNELGNVFIVGHEKINDTLIKVTYENGCVVYVNYADADADVDGFTVPAIGWIAVDGEVR